MPIFKCSKCGCIDNTALADYWWRVFEEKKEPLCSECLTGKWHGEFEKRSAKGMLIDRDGFLWGKDETIPKSVKIIGEL